MFNLFLGKELSLEESNNCNDIVIYINFTFPYKGIPTAASITFYDLEVTNESKVYKNRD